MGFLFTPYIFAAEQSATSMIGVEMEGYYVINLASSLKPFSSNIIDDNVIFNRYLLYTTQFEKDGKTWYRLRLGFFPDMKVAENIKQTYLPAYARAWIAKAALEEKAFAVQSAVFPDRTPTGEAPVVVATDRNKSTPATRTTPQFSAPGNTAKPLVVAANTIPSTIPGTTTDVNSGEMSDERMEALMEEARQAMASADYSRAVQIYTRLLEAPENKYTQVAQEYLGLARERKGQIAHAKAEYEKYLQRYPEGEDSERVKQRLQALITAYEVTSPTALRDVNSKEQQQAWETYGNFSQYYRRDVSYLDDGQTQLNQSLLSSDLDYSARKRTDDYEIRARFTGGYDWDFRDNDNNEYRISNMAIEGNSRKTSLGGIFGRQSQTNGGVMGRFDGLLLSYGMAESSKLNFVTGMPVMTSYLNQINTDQYFYGINMDLGTFRDAWDFNVYYITQQVNNITDREAVGLETRYFYNNSSYYSLIDYDISYQVLNTFFLLGNWTLPDSTNINLTIDRRKSPILTTSNALIGQPVETIADLEDTYTEDEIRQLAEDRTPDSDAYTVSITHPLNDQYQISGDFSAAKLSATPASGGVPATLATGYDYYMSLQLMASDLWRKNDFNIFSLRYADTGSANTTTLALNSRFYLKEKWQVNPLLQINYRVFENNNSYQWAFAPALRVYYRVQRETSLEFELFTERSSQKFVDQTDNFSSYYLSLGYRHEF